MRLFPVFERVGLHVLPDHFHYPVPSTRELDDTVFDRVSECVGLNWNSATQLRFLEEVVPRFMPERPFDQNEGLNVADMAILYAMIREHRPRKIIEVGSGHSTLVIASACAKNAGDGVGAEFIAIDPYPRSLVSFGLPGLTRLVRRKVQSVGLSEFDGCDLLFVDSSHVAGIGSDVNMLILEVLPRLKPGCVVHFHDILVPGEYWRDWVIGQRYYWSEQYLLWAFLLFNRAYDVLWASRYMQLTRGAALARVFDAYGADYRMTSFWIRRAGQAPAGSTGHDGHIQHGRPNGPS